MGDLGYKRCLADDCKAATCKIGENPSTGKPVELDVNGVSAVLSIQAALIGLTAALKAGHEDDFQDKVALTLYGKLVDDPHALCPMMCILGRIMLMLTGEAGATFTPEGLLQIVPKEVPPGAQVETEDSCIFDDEDEDEDEEEGNGNDNHTP